MAMKMNAQPVRGTKDFLPNEVEVRDYVRETIEGTYKVFGFQKINTPEMEDIERLNKSDGGENLSMIFKILKRGQKLDLTKENLSEDDLVDSGLRYDLTMPLSRYFANNRQFLNMPFKAIQIGKVFRAERPQKGRLREFIQCDIDIIGDKTINAEMELIAATTKALDNIGFSDFKIRINDRRILTDMIEGSGFMSEDVMSVCIIFDKLDKIGIDGVKAELIEKGYNSEVIEKFISIISEAEGDALGTALINMGLKGKRIAVIGENRYEWEIAYLSVVCGHQKGCLQRDHCGRVPVLDPGADRSASLYRQRF